MTWADVTSLEPPQAWAPRLEYAVAEGDRKEDVPPDHRSLGPLLPILLCMVPQPPDPRQTSYR